MTPVVPIARLYECPASFNACVRTITAPGTGNKLNAEPRTATRDAATMRDAVTDEQCGDLVLGGVERDADRRRQMKSASSHQRTGSGALRQMPDADHGHHDEPDQGEDQQRPLDALELRPLPQFGEPLQETVEARRCSVTRSPRGVDGDEAALASGPIRRGYRDAHAGPGRGGGSSPLIGGPTAPISRR